MAKQPLVMIDPARRSGMTETEIIAEFQELTKADIRACLVFAADRERRLIGAA